MGEWLPPASVSTDGKQLAFSDMQLEFNGRESGPVLDCLDFAIVHLDALETDDISEELKCGVVELALLPLEVKMVFSASEGPAPRDCNVWPGSGRIRGCQCTQSQSNVGTPRTPCS